MLAGQEGQQGSAAPPATEGETAEGAQGKPGSVTVTYQVLRKGPKSSILKIKV